MNPVRVLTLAVSTACLVALAACASPGVADDPIAGMRGADVTVRTTEAGETIEEYRIAGQLRVVKITPPRGPTYYLVDSNDDGILDSSKGEGTISPVQYKLFEW
ncbi:MAG: DUF2782 domain-containing protein [Pseudomonadota bacterium]|nr:DUF2782 domain-containing protein [Pseudomonadota bacterium]